MLKNSTVGIDIADGSIEIAEVKGKGSSAEILNLSRVKLESGIVERGRIADEARLERAITKAFSSAKPSAIKPVNIIFSLSESQTYTFILNIKNEDKTEDAIKEAIKENIPLPEYDLVYTYKSLRKNKTSQEFLIVAASYEVLSEWQRFFSKLKIDIVFFDIESLATWRGLSLDSKKIPICVLDIGSTTSSLAVFYKSSIRYSYTINKAGDYISQNIANDLRIGFAKAEEKKLNTDLNNNDEAAKSIKNSFKPIISDLKKSFTYFKKKTNQDIGELVLVGGGAKQKGLADIFSNNLKMKVTIGSPAICASGTKLLYLGAIGTALGNASDLKLEFKIKKETSIKKAEKIRGVANKFEGEGESSSNKPKLIAFITILIIGAILISLAFWYKNTKKQTNNDARLQAEESLNKKLEDLNIEEKAIPEEEEEILNIPTTTDDLILEEQSSLQILDTPTGYLNVRSGPGTNNPVVTQVYPEEKFIFLDIEDNWYEIEISSSTIGWVFGDYIEELQ